jgi:hypothetical protein
MKAKAARITATKERRWKGTAESPEEEGGGQCWMVGYTDADRGSTGETREEFLTAEPTPALANA